MPHEESTGKKPSEYRRKGKIYGVFATCLVLEIFQICNLKLHFTYHIAVVCDCLPVFNFFVRALKPTINISVIGNGGS